MLEGDLLEHGSTAMGGAVICVVGPRQVKETMHFSCKSSFLLTQCITPLKMKYRFLSGTCTNITYLKI